MYWFCGFNGFQQVNNFLDNSQENLIFADKFVQLELDSFKEIILTWSNLLLIKDDQALISGFINGKPGDTKVIKIPDQQTIVQGTCNRKDWFFVTSQGKCWKYNLGSNLWKEINYLSAIDTDLPVDEKIIKIALGEIINAGLSSTGRVWRIGSQLSPVGMKVINIDCGKEHGILVTDEGYLYTWGGGSRGQLGNGTLESNEDLCEVQLLAGLQVLKIAAGGWHNAVSTKDGDLYTWGWNKQGQLGHATLGDNTSTGIAVLSEPRVVDWPNSLEIPVCQISCGTSHTVVLLENGEIWGCGWNKWGQLGCTKFKYTCTMTKLDISLKSPICKIICGTWSTLAIVE